MKPCDARQPADPAAERQAADAGVDERAADDARWCAPRRARRRPPSRAPPGDAHDRRRRIDRDVAPIAQVDDQRAVGHRVARDAVAAAADRDRQAEVAGRHDRCDDVVVVADPHDDRGRRWTVALNVVRAAS